MHDMTANNLRSAYGGESMAHVRYKIWARKATEDGFPNVARLFTAISYAEQVHATNHFTELGKEVGGFAVASAAPFGLTSTAENLQGAINGEVFEITEMYPVYLNAAQFQKEKGAELTFHYALTAERIHAQMYQAAKKEVDAGRDIRLGPVQICDSCGWTYEGEAPDTCPICGVSRDRFKTFKC
jgi:rubrerythrin